MGKFEININLGGTIELAVFLTLVLALGRILKLWTISWWIVATPVLVLVAALVVTAILTYLVIIIKNLAERRSQ